MAAAKVVLVGAGYLGRYHLQKVVADPQASLVAVVEPDEGRARAARELLQQLAAPPCAVVPSVADVPERADAAIVATPTGTHLQVVLQCLERHWHVLVEKPMATHTEAAQRMLNAANERGLLLQVGHLERFNPAIQQAFAAAGAVRYVVAERLSPFTGRATDVDVVLDLMVHDLDLLAAFIPAPLTEVRAVGIPVLTGSIDMASARLMFANGTVAQLSAGRTSLRPSRKLRLFTEAGYLSVDCAAKTVAVVRRQGNPGPGLQISAEQLVVPEQDALAEQDSAFFSAVANGTSPVVDGAAGLAALTLAEAVKSAMAEHAKKHGLGLGVELFQ